MAFGCTMRLGEITGLQWDSVDISDEAIEADAVYSMFPERWHIS
jgi:cytochrome c oxidase assembly protein Cox11